MNTNISELQQFNTDFIAVQNGISCLLKDKQGYGYQYADLSQTIGAIGFSISNNGNKIGYIQEVRKVDDGYQLITTIMHVSGYQKEFFYPVILIEAKGMNAVQCLGASVTYSKRYALQAIFGIATEDDDASSFGNNTKKKTTVVKQLQSPQIQMHTPTDATLSFDVEEMKKCNTLAELRVVFVAKRKKYVNYAVWLDKLILAKDGIKESLTCLLEYQPESDYATREY